MDTIEDQDRRAERDPGPLTSAPAVLLLKFAPAI